MTIWTPKGKTEQKRHMYMSLKEAHALFLKEHPDVKIGRLSRFASLRLPGVLLSSQTPANMCTCVYHENVILAVEALHNHHPSIPTYHYEFPASCLKTPDSSDCWFSECSHDLCGFRTTYPLRGDIEVDYAKAVRWMRWEEVEGRTIKAEKKWHCRELILTGIQRVSFQSS